MSLFEVPTMESVSEENQANFKRISDNFGMLPNLYAAFALSGGALTNYLALQGGKSSLSPKACEVVNLVVSEVNDCRYCLSAHTMVSKMLGFSVGQIAEIRSGRATFDPALDALARYTKTLVEKRGKVSDDSTLEFLGAGWSKENLVDLVVLVGEKTISNYLHGVTKVAIDFPIAPRIS